MTNRQCFLSNRHLDFQTILLKWAHLKLLLVTIFIFNHFSSPSFISSERQEGDQVFAVKAGLNCKNSNTKCTSITLIICVPFFIPCFCKNLCPPPLPPLFVVFPCPCIGKEGERILCSPTCNTTGMEALALHLYFHSGSWLDTRYYMLKIGR